jgi:hypothetical protein
MLTAAMRGNKVEGLRVAPTTTSRTPARRLLARMELLQHGRYRSETSPLLQVGDLTLDTGSRRLARSIRRSP